MSKISLTKRLALGTLAVALVALVPSVSFSQDEAAPTVPVASADSSAKVVDPSLTEQSGPSCTACRSRYYTPGTYYYGNYTAYYNCINTPCN